MLWTDLHPPPIPFFVPVPIITCLSIRKMIGAVNKEMEGGLCLGFLYVSQAYKLTGEIVIPVDLSALITCGTRKQEI